MPNDTKKPLVSDSDLDKLRTREKDELREREQWALKHLRTLCGWVILWGVVGFGGYDIVRDLVRVFRR